MAVHAGDRQTAPAGAEPARALEVEVRDPEGVPAKGIAVRFHVVAGRGATLGDTLVATDVDGLARTRLRLGTDVDTVTVAGGVRGQESHGVAFRVAVTPAPIVTSVQPASFASGDTVTLRGMRLTVAAPDLPEPLFGAARGRVVGAPSDTLLRVVAPPCMASGAVAVAVRVGTVTTAAVPATVTGGVAPLSLAPGEAITVRGADVACLRLSG
ncbi:MAG: hypothetical protein JO180_05335, partial [Gemmatirosa sp.]|nr:hypothetical protein [Gemmatirosa sp.]